MRDGSSLHATSLRYPHDDGSLIIPPSYQRHRQAIPYLGITPKYDRRGIDGFPERASFAQSALLQLAKGEGRDFSRELDANPGLTESLLQGWLWFGALYEFDIACGVNYDPRVAAEKYIRHRAQSSGPEKIIATEALLTAVKAAFSRGMKEKDIPLDLATGDFIYIKVPKKYQKYSKGIQRTEPFITIEDLGNLEYVLATVGSDHKNRPAVALERHKPNDP